MLFHSINNISSTVSFKEALFNGMAPNGSLYVPENIPKLSPAFIEGLRNQTLHGLGVEVASRFIREIPRNDLERIVTTAWDFPIPLKQLDTNLFLLELFHGPTLAFKDVGARFMAGVMSYFLEQEHRELSIVVATSGDTGSAVANGFFNIPNITVYVLYPSGKISPLQEKQITTLGGNIHAIEVEGTFDDCQRLVKEAFRDEALLSRKQLTTANSINISRLIPQIVYYFWGNAQLSNHVDLANDPPVITVPSGNLGNLTAALYSKFMGNPVRKFIAATNANDVVPEYFNTGTYTPRPSLQTFSNAMDVGAPSNLARIQALFGNDLAAMKNEIDAVSISDEETLAEIRRTYEQHGYIADPHTAVGIAATRKFREKDTSGSPFIIASTAHPGKFPETIKKAIGIDIPMPEQLAGAFRKKKQAVLIGGKYSELREILVV